MSIDYSTIYDNILKFISTRGFKVDTVIEEDINRSFQFREYIKISAKKNDVSLYVILTSVDNSVVSKLIEFNKNRRSSAENYLVRQIMHHINFILILVQETERSKVNLLKVSSSSTL